MNISTAAKNFMVIRAYHLTAVATDNLPITELAA
jgi:hypothetical protein